MCILTICENCKLLGFKSFKLKVPYCTRCRKIMIKCKRCHVSYEIYKKPKNPIGLSPKQKGPGGPVLEAKKGTLVKKGGQCRGGGIAIRGKQFRGVR